ncbi:MAG: dipeptidase, partial [Petrimonas sp.]|nr:dipeptidase [Petrimonas sp.]MEA5063112.1 dipeptidase [Petrimonas sp.]
MVYTRYSDMSVDMQKVQQKLENNFKETQPEIEKKALNLYEQSPSEAVHFLTNHTNSLVRDGLQEWKELGRYLMVKYVDGVIKKEENGKFKRNPYGQPASPTRPGYSNEFYKKVVDQTGDKYKVQKID